MKADLHFHSLGSDGTESPAGLVKLLKENNVDFACLTDHDTIMCSEEFIKIAKENGILSFPAFELSTFSNNESIHILGYFKDIDSISQELKEYLIQMKENRRNRMRQFVENVNKIYGFHISFSEIERKHPNMIERPHLAEEIQLETNESFKDIFQKYIGNDSPAFIPSAKISTKDGIDIIHKSNGLAILAHPYHYKKNNPIDLINLGVDGVEAIYFSTPIKKHKAYKKYCKKSGLLMTGGSDFHRLNDNKHALIGSFNFDYPCLEELINTLNNKK